MDDPSFSFGPFRLLPTQRALLQDGKPVPLGSRALDLLIVLVNHAGAVVANDELIARVWPNVHVEEGSLRVHVAALRKLLGDGRAETRYIANVPGRGYSFVAPVAQERVAVAMPEPVAAPVASNLPVGLTRVIGRADIVAALATQLRARRFLSIVGPGGIGKTTVAVAVAEAVAGAYPDGVWFVALGTIADARHVPSAVMSALGQTSFATDVTPSLVAGLRDKCALLVLDNCEHVVEAAADLAVTVLTAAQGVHILTTTREPLRAEGEWIQRLPSLSLPPPDSALAASDAMSFPAVQLFNDRAMATLDGFALADGDVEAVVEICRQLGGIPLAIELAAAQVDMLGVRGLAARIDNHLAMLTRGRRTAPPRHQTLRAAIDWSYDLLPETEAAVLRRLAVFAGEFSLETAVAVAGGSAGGPVVDHIANLVAKSLIVADVRAEAQYRLLETTRLYALEKLRAGDELHDAARRHAEVYRDLFARAEAASEAMPQREWLGLYARHIDNVRAALAWAFSEQGDPEMGVALTVVAVPLWVQLSLLGECRERVERALAHLGDGGGDAAARWRMQLSAALGWSLMYGVGRAREAGRAWTATLALADALEDRDYRLRALWGLCIDQFNNGGFRPALDFAQRFAGLVEGSDDAVERTMGDRILATALHYLGDQTQARRHIDHALAHVARLGQQPKVVRFRFDLRVSTHYFLARILWLQGHAGEALAVVERNLEEGRAIEHALTFCSVLGQGACPIAFLAGDYDVAARYGALLLEHTTRHPIRLWHLWARCFDGMVQARRGDLAGGLRILRGELDQAGEARFLPRFLMPLGELAACLGEAGELAQGLAIVDEALARCRARDEGWYVAELLRIKGGLIARDPGALPDAEACFDEALALAREQGAGFWELRCALGLADLRIRQRRRAEARRLLAPVCERLGGGTATADLRTAGALLDSLR